MRFDLVDLQSFIVIAGARSITGGAERTHLALASASARIKGLGSAWQLRFRARLNNFHSIGEMVAAGIGIAVMPEVAARRCARSMRTSLVRIRDPWANRKLAICARSFRALPKPAQQLVEHLRKGEGRRHPPRTPSGNRCGIRSVSIGRRYLSGLAWS
jgi:DNA-binding transcriptional LysR family regulator